MHAVYTDGANIDCTQQRRDYAFYLDVFHIVVKVYIKYCYRLNNEASTVYLQIISMIQELSLSL